MLNDKLYYKIGFDDFNQMKESGSIKYTKAFTIPTSFAYTLGENSFTAYFEVQKTTVESMSQVKDSLLVPTGEYNTPELFSKQTSNYLSLTANLFLAEFY